VIQSRKVAASGGSESRSVAILIPAAGSSSRMRGRDKLLEPVAGEPLIARAARAALATGARVLVALPSGSLGEARREALAGLGVEALSVSDAAEGMAASLRAGSAAAGAARALMILLPDLPELDSADLSAMLAAMPDDPAAPVLRATDQDGTHGHPVILPARLIPALAGLRGDVGARGVLVGEDVRTFQLPGKRATTDLDTPEAWAAWRAGNKE
jgi:molybdenum cofactor cytidylyltransferase